MDNPIHIFRKPKITFILSFFLVLIVYFLLSFAFYSIIGFKVLVFGFVFFGIYLLFFFYFKYQKLLLFTDGFVFKSLVFSIVINYDDINVIEIKKVNKYGFFSSYYYVFYDFEGEYVTDIHSSYFRKGNDLKFFELFSEVNPEATVFAPKNGLSNLVHFYFS